MKDEKNEKSAKLKMQLRSGTYSSKEEHTISPSQWEQIQRVLHGTQKESWIPIKDSLPEEGQLVDIFSVEHCRQINVVFENGCFITYPEKVHRLIKHPLMLPVQWTMIKYWMPSNTPDLP